MYDYEIIRKNFVNISEKDKLTYREMCELVGDKFAISSNTRKNQVARWSVCVNFQKKNNYFTKIKIKNKEELNFDFDYFTKVNNCLQEIKQCKNYPELCAVLGESVLGGSSRDAQIDKWKIYFSWKRSGNKYTRIRLLSLEQVLNNLTKRKQKEFQKKKDSLKKSKEEKYKNFVLTDLILLRTHRRSGHSARNSYKRWGQRGVYLILNKTQEAKNEFGKSVYYIGSTNVTFYDRFCMHLQGGIPETKKLLELKGTQIDFLYIAKEEDTEEFIREKEAEFWAEYKNKGYNLLNKKAPYYHKSSKKKKEKKDIDYFDGFYFNDEDWLAYRKSKIKIKGEKFPRLIKFLREELDLEYSEEFGIWTEKEMIPKIQDYMNSKNDKSEVKLNEVED